MSDDDDKEGTGKRPRKRAKPKKPVRDARGRWLPGTSPNPKGRPKKRRIAYDPSDLYWFGNTQIEISANGKVETMDRRTALLNKIFESAMKGRVSMQRFLYEQFVRTDKQLATAKMRYMETITSWILDNPQYKERDYELPVAVQLEVDGLYGLLHHYHPESYPLDRPLPLDADDDDDDDGKDD